MVAILQFGDKQLAEEGFFFDGKEIDVIFSLGWKRSFWEDFDKCFFGEIFDVAIDEVCDLLTMLFYERAYISVTLSLLGGSRVTELANQSWIITHDSYF
jgi:hypothetical protein